MTEAERITYQVGIKSWTDEMLYEKLGRLFFYLMDGDKIDEKASDLAEIVRDEIYSRIASC